MSDHMVPSFSEGYYFEIEGTRNGTLYIPDDDLDAALIEELSEGESVTVARRVGVLYRLSAPGYMDCTDWQAADTIKEAREELLEQFATVDDDQPEDSREPYLEGWANELFAELYPKEEAEATND